MEFVRYETENRIGVLTIDRPAALNALNIQVITELREALNLVDVNKIRCLVITGGGTKAFVAGADIGQMRDMSEAEGRTFGAEGNSVFLQIEHFPIPVIAAINGYALGGGCELAMCCDFRICSENAVFGQPEVTLGITPGFGGTQRLARLVGPGMAKQMLYTGKRICAQEALRIGLVNEVLPIEGLLARAKELACQIANNAPIAVQLTKHAVNSGIHLSVADGVAIEIEDFAHCFTTQDQKDGMTAFVNKQREVEFHNR